MNKISIKSFSLKDTLESGQIFRWEKIGDCYYISVGDVIIKIKQDKATLLYSRTNKSFDVAEFFDLRNNSYSDVLKSISRSSSIVACAVKNHSGLRIIKQQTWECTASFICSSFSNIKRIRQNLNSIARAYGEKMIFDNYGSYSFPTAAAIADNPHKLQSCGMGYRAKYLAATARMVSDGFDLEKLKNSSYDNAKKVIMQLPGVGSKVADCILLFSLGFTEAFPVDVWMERAIKKHYFGHRKITTKKLADFGRSKFGKNAGYAQQFLYHYARKLKY